MCINPLYILSDMCVYKIARREARKAQMKQTETNKLRGDLTPEQKEKAEKIGRIEFKSAGATRKR